MSREHLGLLITFILGLFISAGALIAVSLKQKNKIIDFSIGLALGVIGTLVVSDVIPEIIENLGLKNIFYFIISACLGFGILKILDHFIPDHDDDGKVPKKELASNLQHIGIITSIALLLHNLIEGMTVYSIIINNLNLGISLMLGIGFHNVPLGMIIGGAFHQGREKPAKSILAIFIVSISTFIGGLILFICKVEKLSTFIVGLLLSITFGMLLYIIFIELIPRTRHSKNKKMSNTGIAVGIIIQLIAILI